MTNMLKMADKAAVEAGRCLLLANGSNISDMERVNFTLLAIVNTIAQTNLLLAHLIMLTPHPEDDSSPI